MSPSDDARGSLLALAGGAVYRSPGEPPLERGIVLIRGDRIVAVGTEGSVPIPDSAEVIDCAGRLVTAGFWNCHVHFFEEKWAGAAEMPAARLSQELRDTFTGFGFTTVFDTGSMWTNTRAIRERVEAREADGPSILSTGEPLITPGAMPPDEVLRGLGYMVFPAHEVIDATQAADATRTLLDAQVDGVKVHMQPARGSATALPAAAIRAAVELAHARGKPVFIHPDEARDIEIAADAGVDVIAHSTPGSGPWMESTLRAMEEAGVALTPTIELWRRISAEARATAIGQLRAWHSRRGTVLFGTDLGAVPADPGAEYSSMNEAGMGFLQILASLTTAPAIHFGVDDHQGRIAAGFQADLVVVSGDARHDVRALSDVKYTIRAGEVIHRQGE